ncbi:MAG: hypothetical protein ACRCYO_02155 [Bacteroidia bacterium]
MNAVLKTIVFFLLLLSAQANAQLVPSREENIDFITTFGKDAASEWGDDDHSQVYFFLIPASNKTPVYIRVFDPETGGQNDQINNQFNTSCRYTIYGGRGSYSEKDARGIDPVGKYKSGIQLATKTFSTDTAFDNKWFTFGPFNPSEGEFDKDLNGHVFKIVVDGISGDDGNMYRFFLSSLRNEGKAVEGANAFAYELCFRLIKKSQTVAHLYPFVDSRVTSIRQSNFDFDMDGAISLTSVAKKLHKMDGSGNGTWSNTIVKLVQQEKNSSLDFQIVGAAKKTNDMVVYMTNQYDEAVPFFSSPIGGMPRYKYKVDVNYEVK